MKKWIAVILFLLISCFLLSLFFPFSLWNNFKQDSVIKVGLVYSSTGFRAMQDRSIILANLMAIEEINREGGLLGKKVVPIEKDAGSNWEATQQAVEELINKDQVAVIFGCWTAESHYKLKNLFEKHHHLLINPYQYAGLVTSTHVINIGTAANQQIPPVVHYCFKKGWRRFFLVGSDYPFAYLTNLMIQDQVGANNGEITGEQYVAFGSSQMDQVISLIQKTQPDVILASINGEDNLLFFKSLQAAGITAEKIPVFSFCLNENILRELKIKEAQGHYASWNYFQSIDTPRNKEFREKFFKFSNLKSVDSVAEAGYFGVCLWSKAVQQSQTTHIQTLIYALADMYIHAPEGEVILDVEGRHAWRYARIGKILPNLQFEIVWTSPNPVRPIPLQVYRSKLEWEELTKQIYERFNPPSFKPIH